MHEAKRAVPVRELEPLGPGLLSVLPLGRGLLSVPRLCALEVVVVLPLSQALLPALHCVALAVVVVVVVLGPAVGSWDLCPGEAQHGEWGV